MSQYADIAAALGRPLWSTDLFIPRYRSGEIGDWRINPGGQLVNDRGYITGVSLVEMLPSLSRKVCTDKREDEECWELWMSLTPHEIESQELGCRYAHGQVAMMGLGMGWIAANAALNPDVKSVTVVELDAQVIELFWKSGAFDSLPDWAQCKLDIVNADALEWSPDRPGTVDFLYADIWLHLAEPSALKQVKQMQVNIKARTIYYWGQEIALYCAAQQLAGSDPELSLKLVEQSLKDRIKLPLLVPSDRGYPQMIEKVIRNRIERGLPVAVEIS